MAEDILVRLRKWLPIVRDDAWAKSLQSDITEGIAEIERLRSAVNVLKSGVVFFQIAELQNSLEYSQKCMGAETPAAVHARDGLTRAIVEIERLRSTALLY